MIMSQELVLYDLPSQAPCRSWSGNVWKSVSFRVLSIWLHKIPLADNLARLALNYKNIPYKTEWTPYTRLEETLKAL